jgi:hypothetical protein
LTTVVHVADQLVLRHQTEFRLDAPAREIGDEALDQLCLTRETIDDIATRIPAALEEGRAYLTA